MYTDKKRKTRKLQELTMKDAFMFGAVLADTEICKDFLEMILGISIDYIQIDTERSSWTWQSEAAGPAVQRYRK